MTDKILYWLNLHDGEGYDIFETEAGLMEAADKILSEAREEAMLEGEWPEDIEGWEIGTMVVTHRPMPRTAMLDGAEYVWERQSEEAGDGVDVPGWEPEDRWEDYDGGDGFNHVRPVWVVKGPAPFGGLRCGDKAQAVAVCSMLNSLTGRRPPVPEARDQEPPNPVAVGIAESVRGLGISVGVMGDVLTFTDGDDRTAREKIEGSER